MLSRHAKESLMGTMMLGFLLTFANKNAIRIIMSCGDAVPRTRSRALSILVVKTLPLHASWCSSSRD